MNLSQNTFINISGIDTNKDANIVFVWGRREGTQDYALLGSGQVVGNIPGGRPSGISVGQYSVTVLLPATCPVADVIVTDDRSGKERLAGVTVRPCMGTSESPPAGGVISGEHVVRANSSGTSRESARF